MTKIVVVLAAVAVVAVGATLAAAARSASPPVAAVIAGCEKDSLTLVEDGTLTKWVYTPFNKAFAPGSKSFDFDINQISYTPARAKVVTFSAPYYRVNQSLVVVKGTKIASVRSVKGLRSYKLGAQLGTTSYQYIVNRIKPSQKPAVFPKNDAAVQALKNKQIDGLVVDLPTAFYVTAVQVPNGRILGQFPSTAGGEYFGMVFQKGNSLAGCVNKALAALQRNGQLARIQQQWLAKATGAPVLR